MVAIAGISFRAVCERCGERSPRLGSANDLEAVTELYDLGWSCGTREPWNHLCPSCNGVSLVLAIAFTVAAGTAET